MLIYVGTKRIADDLTNMLRGDGWPAVCVPIFLSISLLISSPTARDPRRQGVTRGEAFSLCLTLKEGLTLHQRDWVMSEFKAGNIQMLIATDVASRGLGAAWPRFLVPNKGY